MWTAEIADVLRAVARKGLANVEHHARATAVALTFTTDPGYDSRFVLRAWVSFHDVDAP